MVEYAFVGLGSNLGDRRDYIKSGFASISGLPKVTSCRISCLYETPPIDYEAQPHFINAVAFMKSELSPNELLQALLTIEQEHKRERHIANGPRTLDLDLLLYGNQVMGDNNLQLPHPRLTERCFVLKPLLDLDSTLKHPKTGKCLATYLAQCDCMGVHPAGVVTG